MFSTLANTHEDCEETPLVAGVDLKPTPSSFNVLWNRVLTMF